MPRSWRASREEPRAARFDVTAAQTTNHIINIEAKSSAEAADKARKITQDPAWRDRVDVGEAFNETKRVVEVEVEENLADGPGVL